VRQRTVTICVLADHIPAGAVGNAEWFTLNAHVLLGRHSGKFVFTVGACGLGWLGAVGAQQQALICAHGAVGVGSVFEAQAAKLLRWRVLP
jgi:hypothetical protein